MKPTRATKVLQVTIAASEALSEAIDVRQWANGTIFMPAGWTTADLGAKVAPGHDATYVPLADYSNAFGTDVAVDGPVANRAYPMPGWWFGVHYLKLWSQNGSGEDVAQTAARTITICLKA